MVKDHMGYSFQLAARVRLYAPLYTHRIAHTIAFLYQSWFTGWNEK